VIVRNVYSTIELTVNYPQENLLTKVNVSFSVALASSLLELSYIWTEKELLLTGMILDLKQLHEFNFETAS